MKQHLSKSPLPDTVMLPARMWLHSYDIVIRGPRPNCGFGLQNLHRKESRAFYLLDRLVVNLKYLITGYT